MVSFAHIHFTKTKNVGDIYSGPHHYFDFHGENQLMHIREQYDTSGFTAAIYGGGAIAGDILKFNLVSKSKAEYNIAWGIGRSRGRDRKGRGPAPSYPKGFNLCGIRDYLDKMPNNASFVPCVSCMHPLFDKHYEVKWPFVGFFNARRPIPRIYHDFGKAGFRTLFNEESIETTIHYLASAETTVTNSYHGAYWGLLLGKRVIVVEPYSSKFFFFKWPVVHTNVDKLVKLQPLMKPQSPVLEECREINKAFYALVMDMIHG